MANTELQQWISETLKDKQWGSHHKVKIYDSNTRTYKEADWLYTYANRKAIIIEDKEEGDQNLDEAIRKLNTTYIPLLCNQGYTDIISIAIKDYGIKKNVKVYRNNDFLSDELKELNYYEQLLGAKKQIDISKEIFNATKNINQLLHDEFKITHLQDRMLFTGCILVASKQSGGKFKDINSVECLKQFVTNQISSIENNKTDIKALKINQLNLLFSSINVGTSPSKQLIEQVCDICNGINTILKENPLTDIDIMNIFFTEFNRYRGKSENGQVFTPDHIAGLMADLLNITLEDKILDPCCGSGGLLLASSKLNNKNFNNIYGNDFDMNVLRLSYINMLLHNDGITNLVQLDARYEEFINWVKSNKITKVIANPPYENTFALDILYNVLSSVEDGCRVVWLMPNIKMDKHKTKAKKILQKNTLNDIILLGEIFAKTGTGDVSLFIFTKGMPQKNKKIKCWHINDNFKTVKNQGYKDVDGTWLKIKQNFLEKYEKGKYDKEIDPNQYLSYQKDYQLTQPTQDEIYLNLLQYIVSKEGVVSNQHVVMSTLEIVLKVAKKNHFFKYLEKDNCLNTENWKTFKISDIFETIKKGTQIPTGYSIPFKDLKKNGSIPRITVTEKNNGIIGYYDYCGKKKNNYRVYTNFISVSFLGSLFYQEGNASLDMKVHCLKLKNRSLDKNTAIFLISCIKGSLKYSSFADQISSTILPNLEFLLPVDEKNNPDWKFINNYMQNLTH